MNPNEQDLMRQRLVAGSFASNNGAFMRVMNILEKDWKRIEDLQMALQELRPDEFSESLSFLQKAGYIEIREVYGAQRPMEACVANYKTCEAGLTANGIRLSKGFITDPAVRM